MIRLPVSVEKALRLLQEHGFEAYVVGGCVRDALLGKEPDDWDITTSAHPDEIQQVFHQFRTVLTGLQHGTVTVLVDGAPLEITTYRIDGKYTDGRHPDTVEFTRELAEDLRRRDFTVNAMAYNVQEGLIDLYGGRADLDNAIIRCVGDPGERFCEDALRILRALRFASTRCFSIEKTTADAIGSLSHLLKHVSAERIAAELLKLLCGRDAPRVISCYGAVIGVILPELAYTPEQYHAVAAAIQTAPPSRFVRLALLFSFCEQPTRTAEVALKRLRFDNHTIIVVTTLLQHRDDTIDDIPALRRLCGRIGYERVRELVMLKSALFHPMCQDICVQIQELQQSNACCAIADLAVNGNDLLAMGYPPGPAVGAQLQTLLDAVIDERVENQREALLALARDSLCV